MSPASPGLRLTGREIEVLELEWGVQPMVSDSQGLLSSTILHQIPVPLCLDVFFQYLWITSYLSDTSRPC